MREHITYFQFFLCPKPHKNKAHYTTIPNSSFNEKPAEETLYHVSNAI